MEFVSTSPKKENSWIHAIAQHVRIFLENFSRQFKKRKTGRKTGKVSVTALRLSASGMFSRSPCVSGSTTKTVVIFFHNYRGEPNGKKNRHFLRRRSV